MSIRDDAQLGRVCAALLAPLQLAHLFEGGRPTEEAVKLAASGPLSSGERVMLQAAMALWNTENDALRFADAVRVLDQDRLRDLGELLVAIGEHGGAATDAWLARMEGRVQARVVAQTA